MRRSSLLVGLSQCRAAPITLMESAPLMASLQTVLLMHTAGMSTWAARQKSVQRRTVSAEQDNYAVESYRRALAATKEGLFRGEIIPIKVAAPGQRPVLVREDESLVKVRTNKAQEHPGLTPSIC